MTIAVLSANTGNFDKRQEHVPQTVEYDQYVFTDENFPPRLCTLTPRMQARLTKMFSWQMVPDHDYYIWIDSSCIFALPESVEWFVEQCKDVDLVVFKHPNRYTAQQEADYLDYRLSIGCPYITPRYKNELTKDQMDVIKADTAYTDNSLIASTVMVYKKNPKVMAMFKEWWYHTSRYHSDEQLSLPYVIWKTGCTIKTLPDKYTKIKYLKYVRK
jgi:hypothetical protein